MSRRKRYVKQPSKYEAEKIHITSEVIKIELQNQLVNDKYKTVFYCKSNTLPEGRMCVTWEKTRIVVGSRIEMDGRMKDEVFLVWKMTITNDKILPIEINPQLEEIKKRLARFKRA